MKDTFVDVNIELLEDELVRQSDPARYAMEVSRDAAAARCAEAGGELRTDRAPEVIIGSGLQPLTGRHTIMVASRWHATVPDNTEIRRGPDALAGA